MKSSLTLIVVAVLAFAAPVLADGFGFSFGYGSGPVCGPGYYVAPAPLYVPAPVYYPPAPRYVPAPGYYFSGPAYGMLQGNLYHYPAHGYVPRGSFRGYDHRGHGHHH